MIRATTLAAWALLAAGLAQAQAPALLDQAREVASSVPPKLLAVLKAEIDAGGPAAAIGACKDKAPKMAAEASEKTGWQIRRVSLKNRNPKAVPDAWEEAVLKDFDRRAASGEDPSKLEKGEVVSDASGKMYRYMRALPTQGLCLSCHGPAETIPQEVKAKLNELYPADKGTGFTVGQIRGAITIKRPI
jgi:hypothetical protein